MGTQNTSLYGIAIGAVSALALVSTTAFAQAKPTPSSNVPAPVQGAKKTDDKVDISDLENKYWAPKDTDFSVVQNRTYTKDGRYFLTLHGGSPVNDQWSEGPVYGLSGNYFFSERLGVQLTHLKGNLRNNQAVKDVSFYGSGIQPNHGRFAGYSGIGFNVVPFYAKMSFWGKKIIYFDMAFTPTLGFTDYDQALEFGNKSKKGAFTYGIDITQYFFFTNYFAIRADLKNQWHSEEIIRFKNDSSGAKGTKVRDKQVHDTLFLMGLTFFY